MAEGGIPSRSEPVPTPEFKEENDGDKFSVDITQICSNVKYKYQFLSMERIGDVREISNWKETADLTDVWLDHNKVRQQAYYGEKKRTDSAIRNFVTNALAIKTYEQRAAEKAAIAAIRERFTERQIEIYNMSAVIVYLAAAAGVTISPSELVPFLNSKKIKKAGKEYKTHRRSCHSVIDHAIKQLKEDVKKFEKSIKERERFINQHTSVTENPPRGSNINLRSMNAKKKAYGFHFAKRAHSIRTKHYNRFGFSFWDFRIKSDEANDYVFDFLMKYRPNLCKLNPVPSGRRPTLYELLAS